MNRYAWLDKIGKFFNLKPERIRPLVSVQYGWNQRHKPDFRNIRFSFGMTRTQSLYYNGLLYFRLMLPFYIGLMIRWSGDPKDRWQFLRELYI